MPLTLSVFFDRFVSKLDFFLHLLEFEHHFFICTSSLAFSDSVLIDTMCIHGYWFRTIREICLVNL